MDKFYIHINLTIIIITILLLVFVFPFKQSKIATDLKEGEIFDTDIIVPKNINILSNMKLNNKNELLNANKTEVSEKGLKEVLFYSDLTNIPMRFIAQKVSRREDSQVSVYITAVTLPASVPKTNIRNDKKEINTTQQDTQEKKSIISSNKIQSEQKNIINKPLKLDYSILNKAISNSDHTFFYPFNYKNISGVSVGVLSITPYNNAYILKFEVKNLGGSYFFVANVNVKTKGHHVNSKVFFDNIVGGNSSKSGIIYVETKSKIKDITFHLLENEGLNRSYEIFLKVPY